MFVESCGCPRWSPTQHHPISGAFLREESPLEKAETTLRKLKKEIERSPVVRLGKGMMGGALILGEIPALPPFSKALCPEALHMAPSGGPR
ncbi:hypothetical protein Acr_01g0014710 [Actinidia rufa]|uniref:Uncharacterized protein n=1 Tax=Actinidia rufa TaxID=165716 RepID=A0A7J0E577_9ERIC|nr:hypothetical protein Acr_01g0014710 [Actinidia rufa]